MAYEKAKNWRDTQSDIAKLFAKYRIGDTQWSISDERQKAALSFVKHFAAKSKWDSALKKMVETEPERRIVVQIAIPIGQEGKDRNTAFRVLFWYLKSKLEAISFAFQDGTEMLNFEREFFGNTMIEDVNGRPATAYDAFKSGGVALTSSENVIALTGGRESA